VSGSTSGLRLILSGSAL